MGCWGEGMGGPYRPSDGPPEPERPALLSDREGGPALESRVGDVGSALGPAGCLVLVELVLGECVQDGGE